MQANPYFLAAITGLVGIIGGWLAKRPNKIDRDSASFSRLESIVETLQEEMREAKNDSNRLHQDLVASEKNSRELHADLLETKMQLKEVKGLLQEAIRMLERNSIDAQALKDKL